MTRFWFVQLSVASQTRVANSPFLAAPTCTLTPVWNSVSKSPAPSRQITPWLWAWQTLAVRQASKDNASAAALRGNRIGALCERSDRGPEEFSRALAWAKVWQIFAMTSCWKACPGLLGAFESTV